MNQPKCGPGPDQAIYRIRVRGQLDETWSQWFNGLTIAYEPLSDGLSITTLTGAVADQPKLRGILARMWDLNLTVLSVERLASGQDRTPFDKHLQTGGKPWENS